MMKKCFVLIGVIFFVSGCVENEPNMPEETDVKKIMTLVCNYELENTHLADNWQRFRLNSWIPSSF